MTTDRPTAAGTAITVTSTNLSYFVRRRIFLYLGILIVPLTFGAPGSGLIDIPITFLLKNKLHLKAHELADFRLVSGIPLYLSFVFGFIRDTWNPPTRCGGHPACLTMSATRVGKLIIR